MLPPFDIAKLLEASQCKLSGWERLRHMDIIDDIVEDNQDFHWMRDQGITIKIFGSDLDILEQRLVNPSDFHTRFGLDHSLNFFVIATGPSGLFHDFRKSAAKDLPPDDMTAEDFHQSFSRDTATGIMGASQWMLCAPYLSGKLPLHPGWIPVFNVRKGINVRAYFPCFNNRNTRVLFMDGGQFAQAFGMKHSRQILTELPYLSTRCITLNKHGLLDRREVLPSMKISFTHVIAEYESRQDTYLVANSQYALDFAVAFDIG
jgi:hypothetical protein